MELHLSFAGLHLVDANGVFSSFNNLGVVPFHVEALRSFNREEQVLSFDLRLNLEREVVLRLVWSVNFCGCVSATQKVFREVRLAFLLVRRYRRVLFEVLLPDFKVGQTGLFELTLCEGSEVVTTVCQERQGSYTVFLGRVNVFSVNLDRLNSLGWVISVGVVDNAQFF